MSSRDPQRVNPAMASLRMLLDDVDEPDSFEHGRLPTLVWRETGWQNDRPSRFARVLGRARRRG